MDESIMEQLGERRRNYPDILIKISELGKDIKAVDARINGSIDKIETHIKHGEAWRFAIVGIAGLFLIQLFVLAAMWGRVCKTVETNTIKVEALELIHPRITQ